MVLLFSGRKSKVEEEIAQILTDCGGNYISDKLICCKNGMFTAVSKYKTSDVNISKGIAVIIDDTDRFADQIFPKGIIGICESTNTSALKIFEKNRITTVSCGMNPKNTISFSSLDGNHILLTLQRTVKGINGIETEPGDYKILLKKSYQPFSVMASAAVLLLYGILPKEF